MADDTLPKDKDIEWLLTCSASASGQRGTMGSVTTVLMMGGPSNLGGKSPDGPTDGQLDAVKRKRKVEAVWFRIAAEHRAVLEQYYAPSQLTDGMRIQLSPVAGVARLQAVDNHLAAACAHLADPHAYKRAYAKAQAAKDNAPPEEKAAASASLAEARKAYQAAKLIEDNARAVVKAARAKALAAVVAAHVAIAAARDAEAQAWLDS